MLRYGFITFSLQFILVSLPVLMGGAVKSALAGLIIISAIRYIWIIVLIKKYSSPIFSPAFIRENLYLAYPLIISTLLGGSAQYVDGILVLSKFDSAKFAIFSYGAREFPLVLLMANALSAAFIPGFSKIIELTEREVCKTYAPVVPYNNSVFTVKQLALSENFQSGFRGECSYLQYLPALNHQQAGFSAYHTDRI